MRESGFSFAIGLMANDAGFGGDITNYGDDADYGELRLDYY